MVPSASALTIKPSDLRADRLPPPLRTPPSQPSPSFPSCAGKAEGVGSSSRGRRITSAIAPPSSSSSLRTIFWLMWSRYPFGSVSRSSLIWLHHQVDQLLFQRPELLHYPSPTHAVARRRMNWMAVIATTRCSVSGLEFLKSADPDCECLSRRRASMSICKSMISNKLLRTKGPDSIGLWAFFFRHVHGARLLHGRLRKYSQIASARKRTCVSAKSLVSTSQSRTIGLFNFAGRSPAPEHKVELRDAT